MEEALRLTPMLEKVARVEEDGRPRWGSTSSLSTCSSFADEEKIATKTKRRSKTTRRRAPVDNYSPASPRSTYEGVSRTLKI